MTGGLHKIRAFLAPDIPEEIRGEFAILSAVQLQSQSRLLFLALTIIAPAAALAAAPGANAWIRLGAPFIVALLCFAGFLSLGRDLRLAHSPRRSMRFMRGATISSSFIAVVCSTWCVLSWLGAPPSERIYYPVIIALGAFSTAYCLASVRIAALANIAIDLTPMLFLLLTSGNRMDFAVAISLVIAATFQMHMIDANQSRVIDLLNARRRASDLACSDPLTGLLNRRALIDNALLMGDGAPLRLLLVDIDHFKLINDMHGHDVGDQVLCEVAERMAMRAEIMGSVARIGGEEFAILGLADDLPEAIALGVLADIRNAPMPHGAQVTVSIGIAEGVVDGEDSWRRLYQRADTALYAAKDGGRNCVIQAPAAPERTARAA
ncbi:MAG: diguanylate cyclase [Sphingomonadales bacterium]|nr:diguanylate cyclase [Sphingomonadales bacterium]